MTGQLSYRVLEEFYYFMTGKHLGGGMSREVFVHPTDPTKVIKVENSAGKFQNVLEWQTWQDFKYAPKVAKWLAPCHSISDSGTFLIMSRTDPLPIKRLPAKLPQFITDHKIENMGLLDNRVVCHDYAYTIATFDDKLVKWKGEK